MIAKRGAADLFQVISPLTCLADGRRKKRPGLTGSHAFTSGLVVFPKDYAEMR